MYSSSFETPVLLIAWRRPEHLKRVIRMLQLVKPRYVFVAVDGPRDGVDYSDERQLIEKTKLIIADMIRKEIE